MNHVAPDVPPRRVSASPPPISASRKRSFAKEHDQLPTYRSPERKGSLRTDYSHSPSTAPAPSSRSPPPPPSASYYSSYSNGFLRPTPPTEDISLTFDFRGRTFSGGKPRPDRSRSRSSAFNTRYGPEKTSICTIPLALRSRSRSRSPPLPGRRPHSPSFGSSHGRAPGRRGFDEDPAYSTPRARNYARGYEDSPNQLMSPFGPPPHSVRPPDSYPAPPRTIRAIMSPGCVHPPLGQHPHNLSSGSFFYVFPTQSLNDLYNSLAPSHPTTEMLATAVAGLQTAWPQDGTLFVGINVEGAGGRMWLPIPTLPSMSHTTSSPASISSASSIQLANMVERTFILYASHRSPPPPSDAALSRFFQPSASQSSSTPALLHFAPPTVSVSDSFL
ncbi:hypothetical protein C8F04DRAFT_1263024 [Mycena alexandri]|uniref:Uncharacterized protein n=1 Tax=Mycena alexandri TaxID=1745969 RepID=A0AAD6SQB0_9AGAR|nr:hypothetical protein C8F04DRAFT_1263024 [Mycena alexandri]